MNDLKAYKALLKRFEVPYDETLFTEDSVDSEIYITLEVGADARITGYDGHASMAIFTAEGVFIRFHIAE